MKLKYWLALALTLTFSTGLLAAQAPSAAPAGATGQCRDGSYSTAAKKAGACSGHKGVQTWFAASGNAAPATAGQSAAPSTMSPAQPSHAASPSAATASPNVGAEPTSSTAPASSPSAASDTQRSPAPGGGAGQVWVNTSTKVYHCPGKEFYGTTKNGKYMSEADAIAMGARADHNKPCTK